MSAEDSVRVLREGPYHPPPRWRTADCTRCGSLLEYSDEHIEQDGFKVSGLFFDGTAKVKQKDFITCPQCGETVFV